VWLVGLGQLKNPMTSPGIKPATIQPVAQCLNQLYYHMPLLLCIHKINLKQQPPEIQKNTEMLLFSAHTILI
jgi:hypothetical protein